MEVQCGSATLAWFSFEIPAPLSDTSMSRSPEPRSFTETVVAPASNAFSTSSFTAEQTSRMTWPLQILRTVAASIARTLIRSTG